MVSILETYRKELVDLCRRHYVRRLDAFGSAVTGDFGPDSDMDFVVEFDEAVDPRRFDNFFDFQHALETLLERSVDLVEPEGLSNPFFLQHMNQTRMPIYVQP
jgi:predicted nucleotidyltransferase